MDKHNRQSFLGPNSERTIKSMRVAIIGLGGGGSHIAQQLAHIGVGNLFLIDPDTIDKEGTNLNRLIGGTEKDVLDGTLKVDIAKRLICGIDSTIKVNVFDSNWQDKLAVLRNCDVVFGCIDSLLNRRDIEGFTRRYLIPYIDIGMDVHEFEDSFSIGGQISLSMPGRPCMVCMGIIRADHLAEEAGLYGAAGSRPQVVWSNGALASAAVGLMMQLITPWSSERSPHLLLEFDGNQQTVTPSEKLIYLDQIECGHYSKASDSGDPFLI